MKKKAKKVKKENSVFSFTAVVQRTHRIGAGHYVEVPFSVEKRFGVKGRIRVLGTMNGIEVDRALIPAGASTHIIMLGTDLRKKAKVSEGDKVVFELHVNPDQDHVDIPEELFEAMALEPEALEKFEKLTPGMKRNMAYWVNSAKLPETRAKRAVELLKRIMTPGSAFGGSKITE